KWSRETPFSSKTAIFPETNLQAYRDLSPLELFELFFDEEVYLLLKEETTRYALFKGYQNPEITVEEMKCFVAILIISGYNKLPGKRYYWDQEDDMRNESIYNALRRNRFETIMQFLHMADNTSLNADDKYAKIRPFSELLRKNFMEHFCPSQQLSHDETMIEYFGKHGCKQCIRNKPIRFGYKVWCLNNRNGYLVNFDIYQGKTWQGNTQLERLVGKCGASVLHLFDGLPEEKKGLPYELYFDNLFTGFELMLQLRDRYITATGTVRDNRLHKCPIEPISSMSKKDRGSFDSLNDTCNNVHVCRWLDNSVVTFMSTCHGVKPVSKVKRYSKKEKRIVEVDCPNVTKIYNTYMGYTDQFNKDNNRHRIGIRGKKWWWCLFTWLLDASVINAWKLSPNPNSQLEFRRHIANSYLKQFGTAPIAGGRPSQTKKRRNEDIRTDQSNHFIVPSTRRRCAGQFCKKHPASKCEKCDVGLCINCFKDFHSY
ncbi:UNVERIFIED_CONTAM: hypothetical protein GTU68_064841, partial [Idotea baltica]|nr:hypothetical protein [Idotea baltica]